MKGKKMDSEVGIRGDVNKFNSMLNSLEEELVKTKERAELSEKLKSAFLNNISHEIRTPLNGILGFIDFFNDDLPKDDRQQFVAIMRKSGERLLNTVDNIIEMSKLESGILKVNKCIFNLKEALNEFNKEIKHKYSNSLIEYICSINVYEKQTLIEADRLKMFQILRNIIDNAYKFTNKGYVKLTVKQENNTLIFEVEDTGIGIRKEDRNVIFEPFRQADFNLNRKHEGNGLGLSISKQLIHLMDGELTNERVDNIGARFKCSFPDVIIPDIRNAEDKKTVFTNERTLNCEKFNITKENYSEYKFFKTVC